MTSPVSVLLPARNASATLRTALDSILAQTYREIEVILVDDGSTDATREIAENVAARDGRVTILDGAGRGIVSALEQARGRASGDYLARMDADDVALPGRLEAQVEVLEAQTRVGLCGTGVRYVPEARIGGGALRYQRWLNGLRDPADLRRDRFIECPLAHPTWMMRADAVGAVGGYRDPGWPEDYDLLLRMAETEWVLATVPRVLLLWRESGDRLSRTHLRYDRDAFGRCRAHYLARAYPRKEGVVIWGAGPTGKAFSRSWRASGGTVRAFVEIDPRKVGQEIHGAPVIPPEELPSVRGALGVAAVGRQGARNDVRRGFRKMGWIEEEDFVAVA